MSNIIRQDESLEAKTAVLLEKTREANALAQNLARDWQTFTRSSGFEFGAGFTAAVDNSVSNTIKTTEMLINKSSELTNIAKMGINRQAETQTSFAQKFNAIANENIGNISR